MSKARALEIITAADDSMAATEPLLPTAKLVEHSKWMRRHLREAAKMVEALQEPAAPSQGTYFMGGKL